MLVVHTIVTLPEWLEPIGVGSTSIAMEKVANTLHIYDIM